MGIYFEPWKKYADFSGRATRTEYWTFVLVNMVIAMMLYVPVLTDLSGSSLEDPDMALYSAPTMVIYWIFSLAVLLPNLAVTVRRLHDTGRSGWWYFIGCVPLIGGLALFVFMLLDSEAVPNQYG